MSVNEQKYPFTYPLAYTPAHTHSHSKPLTYTPWHLSALTDMIMLNLQNIVQLYLKYATARLYPSLIHPHISTLKYNPSRTGYTLIYSVPLHKVVLTQPICIYTDRRLTCFFIELTFSLMDTEHTHGTTPCLTSL